MTGSRKLIMFLAAFLFVPAAGYTGQDTLALLPAGSMPPLKAGRIPNEMPMPMMQFPPLNSMSFPKLQSMQVVPAKDFVDGADLYRRLCSDCHGIQTTTELRGIRFSQFSSAVVGKKSGMERISTLKKEEITAIINVLKNSPAS